MNTLNAVEKMRRARAAQVAWTALPVRERCGHLAKLRQEFARQCHAISAVIARDTGKPLLDALAGDVLVTLEQMLAYERKAARMLRPRRIGKPLFLLHKTQFETRYEPHGVALICGPSNYPFQLSVVPMITALTAGNAVILKCSERAPETAALIAELCVRVGLPQDLVQITYGAPEEVEAFINAMPDLVFFTGSSEHGRQVALRAARHLIPTILELGGKDASLVFEDCHVDRAVEGIAYGAFSNAGRVCVAVKRVYVQESIYDTFIAKLEKRIAGLCVGNEPDADLCPLTSTALSLHLEQVNDALDRGARLCFPHKEKLGGGPVLLTDVPADARLMTEESFGPALVVDRFRGEAEAIELANASPFHLSSSVWTQDRARAWRIAAQMRAGSCAINDVLRVIANPYAPFGGNGKSGYGRYHGSEGLHAFSRTKTIMQANDRGARQINWFPFTSRTRKQLSQLIRIRHGMGGLLQFLSRVLPCLLLVLLLPLGGRAQTRNESHLTVDVQLPAQVHGDLGYLVFLSAEGFPGDVTKAIRHGFVPISSRQKQMRIDLDLPPGTYAVSVYEDLNGNHKLDHNFLGIPREPVGASNNPKRRFGPPRFDECAFELGSTPKIITINLVKGL